MTAPQATLLQDVRCVLFDLDGTLIDSAPDLAHAADAMRIARGLPPLPFAAYRASAGSGARGMLAVAFGSTPNDAAFSGLRDEFLDRYERCMTQRTHAFPGVDELLSALAERGLVWGVVTNKARRFTAPLLAGMPLFAGAAAVISGDTTPHTKPHPAPVIEAMRQSGVTAAQCLYVGDDERDVIAGRDAGVRTVAARYGYLGQGADPDMWGADAIIDQPLQLLKLLDSS